jgi:hypothetical protein
VWYSGKDKSVALVTCFTSGHGNSFFTGSGNRMLSEEEVVEEISMKDLVETPVDMGVPLSGSEIDEVF